MLRFLTGIFFAFCTIFGDMTLAAVDAGAAQVAHGIGDAKAAGKLNQVAHKAAHAGAGALKEQLKGGDPLAGAIGAVVAETAAEAMDKPGATHEERQKIAQKARLVGDTVAFVAGRDVTSADSSGATAVENNFAREHALAMFIERRNIVNNERLSDEKKQQRLAEVDELSKQIVLAGGKGAAIGFASSAFPTITAGYFATQSAAHWAGTYSGGGIEAVKQEFRDHPIASTVDVATTGMLGAGFVKGMTKPGLQVMGKQPLTRVYQPTLEQSALSLQYGNKGMKGIVEYKPLVKDAPARHTEYAINDRRFCGHAVDQMQNRGIHPSAVENKINVGKKEFSDEKILFYDRENNITVITETNGDVVSTYYGKGKIKK